MIERLLVGRDELASLAGQTILITGADGMLASAFCDILADVSGCRVVALNRRALDVRDRRAVLALDRVSPNVIVHCAAKVDADYCERHPAECRQIKVDGARNVLDLARSTGAQVVYPQSVFVFDGVVNPALEGTPPNPLSEYGRAKWEAEQIIAQALPESLIVRMAGFFGGDARDKNFVGWFTRNLFKQVAQGQRTCRIGQRVWQPTYTRDLAANILLLIAQRRSGVYHMASYGEASFFEVASACVEELGMADVVAVQPLPDVERRSVEVAPRPERIIVTNARLAAEGLDRQRHWRSALREYLARPYFQSRVVKLLSRS